MEGLGHDACMPLQIAEVQLQAEEASKTIAELRRQEGADAAEAASLQAKLIEAERLAEVGTQYVSCLCQGHFQLSGLCGC